MSPLTSKLVVAAVSGQVVGLLGWIDPLFIPIALLGPVITGAIAAAREMAYPWIAVLWCSVGLSWLWTDWIVTGGDQLFHLATSVIMPLLAGVGYGVVRLATRSRRRLA